MNKSNPIQIVAGAALLVTATLVAPCAFAQSGETVTPLSVRLTECATIFRGLAIIEERNHIGYRSIDLYEQGTADLARAAVRQAGVEGYADPVDTLSPIYTELQERWGKRLLNPADPSRVRGWIDYCRSLGRATGALR